MRVERSAPFRLVLGALVVLLSATLAQAAGGNPDDIVGVWLTEHGEGKIKIFRCGDKYCGKSIWIRPTAEWPDPTKATDIRNPNPQKRDRKLLGATMLRGLTFDADAGVYENGRIYDSTRGAVFKCKAWLQNGGKTLKLRGFVGVSLLGQNTVWSRVK